MNSNVRKITSSKKTKIDIKTSYDVTDYRGESVTSYEFLSVSLKRRHFLYNIGAHLSTGCPKKHGNSVTNLISSLLWISIVIPNFKSHNIIMSSRAYFMKRVKDCKDVSIMSPQDEQWRRTSLLCSYTAIFLFY